MIVPVIILIVLVIGIALVAYLNGRLDRELEYWRDAMHQRDSLRQQIGHLAENPSRPPRVENIDWALALGLNTASWRITDPDDGDSFVTDDIDIAVNSLDWGCTVETASGEPR